MRIRSTTTSWKSIASAREAIDRMFMVTWISIAPIPRSTFRHVLDLELSTQFLHFGIFAVHAVPGFT